MTKNLEAFCLEHKLVPSDIEIHAMAEFLLTQPAMKDLLNRRRTDITEDIVVNNPETLKFHVKRAIETYLWTLTLRV